MAGSGLGQQFFPGRDLAATYGRSAAGTQIIENLPIRQHEQKPFPHGHRGSAFVAVEAGRRESVKLLLVHTRLRSRSAGYRAELWRAAGWRQPQRPAPADKRQAPASTPFRKYRAAAGCPPRPRRRGGSLLRRAFLIDKRVFPGRDTPDE